MKTYQLIISGRVQKVNYRNYVLSVAQMLDYVGYVKNLPNKTVEVIVNAKFEEELEFFISKLYEGSLFSRVKHIEYRCIDAMVFEQFEVR